MRTRTWIILLAVASLGAAAAALVRPASQEPAAQPPATPRGVRGIVFAQPFVLEAPYVHTWRAEQPPVSAGWIAVLEVDRELVVARQTYEPVLYAGRQTVERVNQGSGSGLLVCIVPAELDPAGVLDLDLASEPIWFGTPRLPEQVDAATIAAERALAQRAGLMPLAAEVVERARARGGDWAAFRSRTELERYAASLIHEWSPDEHELAESMLAPLIR